MYFVWCAHNVHYDIGHTFYTWVYTNTYIYYHRDELHAHVNIH